MRKLTFLATILMVMAAAVSCEKKAEAKDPAPQPTGEMRLVTVSAGQATERTSVAGGTLTWSKDDQLSIVPTAGGFEAVALEMISDPGDAFATFQGMVDAGIKDNTELYGWAGGAWTYSEGTFTIEMNDAQAYVDNGLAENAYPSIGTGTINSEISLKNPFGVLSLNIKGGEAYKVKGIKVTSVANNLAGVFTVDPSKLPATVTGGDSNELTLTCTEAVALATDGKKFYMVIPAAVYADKDLAVTLTMSDNSTFEATLGATTVTAGSATTVDVVYIPPTSVLDEIKKKSGEWKDPTSELDEITKKSGSWN